MFQSARPYGARLSQSSITMPATGFQSTRPYGARPTRQSCSMQFIVFQPTRPYGARHTLIFDSHRLRTVSIYAPVWGATVAPFDLTHESQMFQSTRPYGARLSNAITLADVLKFQSTRPYGARLTDALVARGSILFQSTRPYGARPAKGYDAPTLQRAVSIHAPVWGATHSGGSSTPNTSVSIHAPVWGATALYINAFI